MHFPIPVLFCPASEMAAADQAGLVVVGAEIRCAGMRDVDGDDGELSPQILGGNGGSHCLVSLELDDQMHLLSNQPVCIAQSHPGLVSIIDRHHLHMSV